jgi:hypothetical protein
LRGRRVPRSTIAAGTVQALRLTYQLRTNGMTAGLDLALPLALLRARRKRPNSRAAEKRDEIAPLHTIAQPFLNPFQDSGIAGCM